MLTLLWNDLIENGFCKNVDLKNGSAVTVGSFDGPHRGHFAIFKEIFEYSKNHGTKNGIITFERPVSALKEGENYKGDISTLEERLKIFSSLGFDFSVVIHFDENFKNLSGQDFFSILKEKLNLKFIAEGIDFRCGHNGAFGKDEIEAFCAQNGIDSVFVELVKDGGKRISSTMIRELLQKNDLNEAKRLLGIRN